MAIGQLKLNTGAEIPVIGLGTWQSKPGEVAKAVEVALKAGYRHLDCAFIYGNEKEVGDGIRASGVKREEIFVTSKLWGTYHNRAEECLDKTLGALGLDYIDLYLVHWPVAMNPNGNHPLFPKNEDGSRDLLKGWDANAQTWKGMEAVLKTGKTKAIGVSNWSIPNLEKLLAHAQVAPAANQVELHPYLPQPELVKYCQDKGIVVEAYSPLGSTDSPLLKEEKVVQIAKKHGSQVGNVLISYQIQRGVVPLPKSVTPSRIESNLNVVPLDDHDMADLNSLHKSTTKRFAKPDWGVHLGFADY